MAVYEYANYSDEELEAMSRYDDYAASELLDREKADAEDQMYYDEMAVKGEN